MKGAGHERSGAQQRSPSMADGLGLDATIGGHDALVVLATLVLTAQETGRAHPLPDLAAQCGLAPDDLMEGVVGRLNRAGYVVTETKTVTEDGWHWAVGAGPEAELDVVSVTREGTLALRRHLAVLSSLPRSLQKHMLGKWTSPDVLETGAHTTNRSHKPHNTFIRDLCRGSR